MNPQAFQSLLLREGIAIIKSPNSEAIESSFHFSDHTTLLSDLNTSRQLRNM